MRAEAAADGRLCAVFANCAAERCRFWQQPSLLEGIDGVFMLRPKGALRVRTHVAALLCA